MKTKVRNSIMAITAALSLAAPGMASAAYFLLPTPDNSTATYGMYPDATGTDRQAILMDGIPVAFKYDDFWSYSGHILESIQTVNSSLLPTSTFGTYDFSTGTGVILVNLTSVAGGATNPFNLQNPVDLQGSGNNVTGWVAEWGNINQSLTVWQSVGQSPQGYDTPAGDLQPPSSTSTVGEMLAALQSLNPDWTIPLIYADYNQTGGGDSMFMSAQVRIIDPSDGSIEGFWQLDSLTNNIWDQTLPTYNFGDITFTDAATCASIGAWDPLTGVGCAGVTTSGLTYTGSHNLGSGKADFMAYAPDMDLSKYDKNWLWVVTVNLGCNPQGIPTGLLNPDYDPTDPKSEQYTTQGCNTNGFEEFGFIGGVGPTDVPEPHSLALLGLGFAAAGFGMRRRVRN